MINLYNINNTDFTKNGNATLEALRCEFRVEVNGAWSIELEIPYDSFGKWKLVQKDTMLKVDVDCIREFTSTSQLFRVDNYRKTETSLVVIAYSVGMEARHDVLIKNLTLKNKTASEVLTAFAQYIDNNKYTLYTDLSTTGTISLSNSNLISAISYDNEGSFTKVFGGEIVYDNKTIKILNRIGNSTPGSHPVIYGKNMTGISYQEDSSGMVTRIYPISTDGVALLTQDNKDYVDSDYAQIYPYLRKRYMTAPYQLIDDVANPITPTQVTTRTALDAVKNKAKQLSVTAMKHAVSCLGDNIPYGAIKKYKSEVIEAVCDMATTHCLHATLDSKMEKYIKDGMNDKTGGMFSVPEPEYSWHGDYEDGWWYGDDSAAWATDKAYARNEYKYISKKWSYFDNDGKWEMPKDDNGDWDWWQPQDGLADKFKYGNFDRYYAKDEWIYITANGTLTAYWIDGDGYYDDSYTEASTWTWHGTGAEGDPYWFGASDAAGDPDKYAHDEWVFIDGTLYWFDNYGYYDGQTKMDDYQWDWVESENKYWFGNNEDKTFASIYLQSQWAKIDSDYYYFDQDGYAIDEEEMIIMIIQSFLTSMASLLTEVDAQKAALYAKLYEQMEDWSEKQFSVEHIDLPAVTISVNMIDLQKTQEYKDYAQLEKICLGDAVDCQNPKLQIYSQERVIGLTYDCIRGYNTSVTIGHTEASLGSVLSNSSGSSVPSGFDTSAMESAINTNSNAIAALQNNKQDKLTAGQNISIVNNVISATGGGLQYWHETTNRFYREGTHEGVSGLADYLRSGDNEIGYYLNGAGMFNCYVIRLKNAPSKVIEGICFAGLKGLYVFASPEEPLDYEWGYSNNTYAPPYGVTEWRNKETYPPYIYHYEDHSDNYLVGSRNITITYEGTTWYILLVECAFWEGGDDYSAVETVNSFNYWWNGTEEQINGAGLALLEAAHARPYTNITTEIGTENYAFKYGGEDKTYASIDTDGNALVKEITTDAGTLTSQMAQKQNVLTAGVNVSINNNTISAIDTTYNDFAGSIHGLVPPVTTQSGKFLKDDGTWDTPSGGGSSVIANPSETPTDTLQTVEIDGTIYEIEGGSGGGGSSYNENVLYTNSGTTAGNITLSSAYTDYDMLYFDIRRSADNTNYQVPYAYLTSEMIIGEDFQVLGYNEYISYDITSTTEFTKLNNGGAWYIYKIVGIKFGSGSSGGGNTTTYGTTPPTDNANNGDTYYLLDTNDKLQGTYLYMTNVWKLISGHGLVVNYSVEYNNSQRNHTDTSHTFTATVAGTYLVINQDINGEASTKSLTADITTTGTVIATNYSSSGYGTERNHAVRLSIVELAVGDTVTMSNTAEGSYTTQQHSVLKLNNYTPSTITITRTKLALRADNSLGTSQTITATGTNTDLFVAIAVETSGAGLTNNTASLTVSGDDNNYIDDVSTGLVASKVGLIQGQSVSITYGWANVTNYVTCGYILYKLS